LIAIAIEALYSDRLKDFYELLSFHYEIAEEWAKAAEYLNRTGRKVREIYTDDESREFFSRKEIALEKLYESKGVRRVGWNIFGIITAVISAIFIFSLAYGFIKIVESYLQVPLLSRQINQGEELKFHASLAEIVVVFLFAVLIIWFVIYVIFFWIIPFIRSRPQLFDLYGDELQIRMGRGKSISIPFTDIASMKYMDNERGASRPLKYRILDPWQLIGEYGEMGILSWWKAAFINWPLNSIVLKLISLSLLVISMIMLFSFIDVNNHPNTTIRLRPHLETLGSFYLLIFTSWLTWILSGPFPYPMGFGATSGEIYIKRKSGYHRMRVITPWMNAPAKSRLIFISPQDSGDYFEQLEVAYSKWLKTYNKRSM
ncbi:MAG: hypothetical protein IIB41_05215, partial [Candidatus Marinimicrobia bacterium]|nr:hypothetical protein [Candidatus Neomarinimicrobiota bacterium]